MFDKDLFYSLCNKYNVKLSKSSTEPIIKEDSNIYDITSDDTHLSAMIMEEVWEE